MKKKKVLTRRRRALGWLGRLVVLILACQLIGLNFLFPARTISGICQTNGMEETEVFYSAWGQYSPMKTKRVYLSRNDDVILLSAAQFHPMMGWYSVGPGLILDPDDPECRDGTWFVRKKEGDAWICLAGFVPEGERPPTFSIGHYQASEEWVDDIGYQKFANEPVNVTPEPNIPVEGGSCYLEFYPFETREGEERVGYMIARNTDGYLSEFDMRLSTIFM